MKPLVIYHADCADGFGAAFAAWLKFGDDAEYKPMKYGDTLNEEQYYGRDVHILDFSFPRHMMSILFASADSVTWLDHHKTAFEMYDLAPNADGEYPRDIKDIGVDPWEKVGTNSVMKWHHVELDNTRSGALIAWEYFHPEKPVPLAIRHIDDYDRWQFKIDGTKEFIKALWSYAPWTFEIWRDELCLLNDKGHVDMYFDGDTLIRNHNQNVQSLVPDAIVCEIPLRPEVGARGLAVNSPHLFASDLGHELANRSGTYGLVWQMGKDGMVKCSLRSNGSYDVSAIAQEFGGGGHRNAAGCRITMGQLQSWLKP